MMSISDLDVESVFVKIIISGEVAWQSTAKIHTDLENANYSRNSLKHMVYLPCS